MGLLSGIIGAVTGFVTGGPAGAVVGGIRGLAASSGSASSGGSSSSGSSSNAAAAAGLILGNGNPLGHFLTVNPLSVPNVDQAAIYSQLETLSAGMYAASRRYMAEDMEEATRLTIRSAAYDARFATTLGAYRADYIFRRAGLNSSASYAAGSKIREMLDISNKFAPHDMVYQSRAAINATGRLLSNYLQPSRAIEDSIRRSKEEQAINMLANSVETMYGFRGLASFIPEQALGDIASGVSEYHNKQLFELDQYKTFQRVNDFQGQGQLAGYLGQTGVSIGLPGIVGNIADKFLPKGTPGFNPNAGSLN
jgi:hypothetical protein